MLKENYFNLTNRTEKIRFWLEQCNQMKSHYPFSFQDSGSALIVLDMQNYFLDKSSHAYIPASDAILVPIQNLIKYFRAIHRPTIFTRHIASLDETDLMNHWWRDSIQESNPRSEISQLLNSQMGIILKKSKYSAFQNTSLDEILKQNHVNQLVICGVMTHLCCESTIRDAFMHNYQAFFVVDGTATYTEQLHLGSLRAISHGFGKCVASEEIINGK